MPTLGDRVGGFEWLDWVVEKISQKHGVQPQEVEQCFYQPFYKLRRVENDGSLRISVLESVALKDRAGCQKPNRVRMVTYKGAW